MNPLTILNAVANAVVVLAVVGMAFRVFGNPDHEIHAHRELYFARKFVSSLVICGAVLNIATLSTPSWTEVVLNYGFAANYLYSLIYDVRIASPKHSFNAATLPRKRATRRTGGSGNTSANPPARSGGRKRNAS
jgi:hypothetical protein